MKCYDIIESSYEIDEGATEDLGDGCTAIVSSNPKIVSVSGNKITPHDLGSVVITGYNTYNGYCTIKMNVTVKGEYLKAKGIYNEELSNSVYDALKDGFTRHENYFPDPAQIPFLLATVDKWYKGEITTYRAKQLMKYIKFNLPENFWGGDVYYVVTDDGRSLCEIVLEGSTTPESIVNGINLYMRGKDWQEDDWDWARPLLYIKVNVDNASNKTYVYLIQ